VSYEGFQGTLPLFDGIRIAIEALAILVKFNEFFNQPGCLYGGPREEIEGLLSIE
jgi:hypothetical protein